MEERFLTGFCRQADQSRIVAVEYDPEAKNLEDVDCCYETCIHRAYCEIGKAIAALLA